MSAPVRPPGGDGEDVARSGLAPARGSGWQSWTLGTVVGLVAFAWLAYGRQSEPYFLDESSYIIQGYHADLLLGGRFDDPAWLALPAVDQPPLMKYLVGLALRVGRHPRGGAVEALAWQRRYNLNPVPPGELFVLRLATPGCSTRLGGPPPPWAPSAAWRSSPWEP